MFGLLAFMMVVAPASAAPTAPSPHALIDATDDALIAPPYTLVEVHADGTVSVDHAVVPVVLPVGGDAPRAPELVAALQRAKLTNPNGPAILAVEVTGNFLQAVQQALYSSKQAGFTTLFVATQTDPADPPGSWRGVPPERLDPDSESPILFGALDKSVIDAVVKQNMNQVRYCYQRELAKQPSLAGDITVKFVISGTGSVSKAEIKSSTMGNPTVESCITSRFLHWQFPAPKGGGNVVVSYPFVFTPG